MSSHLRLYTARGSGGVAVEAALTLAGAAFERVDAYTWDQDDPASGDQVLAANPMRQVPTLVLPDGEVLTESAAILLRIAELYPEAALAPAVDSPQRGQFLRWMSFVSSAIYSLYWVRDAPSRLVPDPAGHAALEARVLARISDCWGVMEAATDPQPFVCGAQPTVLDLYVATVSRFSPRRTRFYEVAPRLGEAVRLVDELPALRALWAERFDG